MLHHRRARWAASMCYTSKRARPPLQRVDLAPPNKRLFIGNSTSHLCRCVFSFGVWAVLMLLVKSVLESSERRF